MGRWIQLRDADMSVGYTGGWCLAYVQNAFHTDHPFPTALAAWNANVGGGNHPGEVPPLGITVPVYFSLVGEPAGHVAARLDDGYVASSSDPGYHARPYLHPNLDHLMRYYGGYRPSFLGWSEWVGYVKVVGWEDYHNEEFGNDILFERITEEDPTLPLGETRIKQVGVNGRNSWTDQVRTVDGTEQSRTRIAESNTSQIPEITVIGTYVEPEPTPDPEPEIPTPDPVDPGENADPIGVPPVKNENNLVANIIRLLKALFARLMTYINEQNSIRH